LGHGDQYDNWLVEISMLKLVVVSGPEIFEKLVIVGDTFAINNHLLRKKVLDLYI
jgi:hypothetical protein